MHVRMYLFINKSKQKQNICKKSDRIMQIGTSCVMRRKPTRYERVGSALPCTQRTNIREGSEQMTLNNNHCVIRIG